MEYTDDQIRTAIAIVNSFGIGTFVPGCYDVGPETGLMYARSRKAFYADVKTKSKIVYFEYARTKAASLGVSFEDYCHFLRYRDCPMRMQPNGSYFDTPGWYETCSGSNKRGERCKRQIHFWGKFEDFKPGISDRCKWHGGKKRKG